MMQFFGSEETKNALQGALVVLVRTMDHGLNYSLFSLAGLDCF